MSQNWVRDRITNISENGFRHVSEYCPHKVRRQIAFHSRMFFGSATNEKKRLPRLLSSFSDLSLSMQGSRVQNPCARQGGLDGITFSPVDVASSHERISSDTRLSRPGYSDRVCPTTANLLVLSHSHLRLSRCLHQLQAFAKGQHRRIPPLEARCCATVSSQLRAGGPCRYEDGELHRGQSDPYRDCSDLHRARTAPCMSPELPTSSFAAMDVNRGSSVVQRPVIQWSSRLSLTTQGGCRSCHADALVSSRSIVFSKERNRDLAMHCHTNWFATRLSLHPTSPSPKRLAMGSDQMSPVLVS
ncbi:uncharacterized protein UTRI_00509 [Ustilago trichophora]|uniref:Uncharacterized protein n=1 Tax=Ustilago trichophora TaxID=86804 RepID=A0A5C3DS95_9BASI|nr:uncharacterized protein UTRI_00509 [Ustilago trichophora]